MRISERISYGAHRAPAKVWGEMAAATWSYQTNRSLVAIEVVAGAVVASGAGLPPARHPIAAGGPGPGQVPEVPEREVSEA